MPLGITWQIYMAVPNISKAAEYVEDADVFVIIGTSLNVYPAAGLLHYVRRGVPVYLIDPNPVLTPDAFNIVYIQEPASVGIEILLKKYLSSQQG